MGPKGHPKLVPWDQKVIPPKTLLTSRSITSLYSLGGFPKKAKNQKSGGIGFRQPQSPKNMVSGGPYCLFEQHKKGKWSILYLKTSNVPNISKALMRTHMRASPNLTTYNIKWFLYKAKFQDDISWPLLWTTLTQNKMSQTTPKPSSGHTWLPRKLTYDMSKCVWQ